MTEVNNIIDISDNETEVATNLKLILQSGFIGMIVRLACARIFTEIEKIIEESVRCTETTSFNSQNMAYELLSLYTNFKDDSFDVHLNNL
jgi:hypothetical protein